MTALPLLLFAAGARQLQLATLGMVQYILPSLQFLLGLWVFHEPLDPHWLLGFVCFWCALLLVSIDAWRGRPVVAAGVDH